MTAPESVRYEFAVAQPVWVWWVGQWRTAVIDELRVAHGVIGTYMVKFTPPIARRHGAGGWIDRLYFFPSAVRARRDDTQPERPR